MRKLTAFLLISLLVLIGFQNLVLAQTFTKGDIVEVYNTGGVGLKVRDAPCGQKIGNKPDGNIGLILEGWSYCVLEGTGYYWWRIRWSDGLEGWSAQNWLRKLSLPSITSASPAPSTVSPGGTVTLTYNVTNPGKGISGAIAPLLGASIQPSGGGNYLSDPANDRKASIPSGSSSVSRPFVVPTSATPGTYDLLVSLVADINNNGQIDSGDRTWELKRFSRVLQVRVTCTYSIFPTNQSFGSAGGSGVVNVTAPSGCPWTATSNTSWITITSGSSGSGNGTLNYSVASNPSTSSRTGTMTIAGQTFTVNQAGAAAPILSVTPASHDFGSVYVGSFAERDFTVQNTGGGTLTGSASTSAPFSIVSGGSFSLGAGQTQIVRVRFSPISAGNFTGSVSFTSNGGNLTRSISGVGVTPPQNPVLEVTPNSLDFGDVTVGQCSANQSFTVKNAGGGTLNGSASTSAPFSIVSGTSFSLGANQGAQVIVRFCPITAGLVNGNVNFTSNGGNISHSVSGNGVTQPSTLKVKGIDVSHWQGNIDWTQVYKAGYAFAFIKATEGIGFTDSFFTTNMDNGRNAGMLMGAYHFARPDLGNSAIKEAEYFVSVIGRYLKEGYLRPVLDLEVGASLGKAKLSQWVHDWMNTVQSKTGIQPILYVNSNYANNYLDTFVNKYNLWIAHWTYDPDNTSPNTGIWSSWDFWQYSDKGSVPGIAGDVDLDVFNGDLSRLNTFMITSVPVTVCPDVTVTSSPSSVTYTKKNQTKYIYATITNSSGASRKVMAIAKQSDEPFIITKISPGLPYTIRNGRSETFKIYTKAPSSGKFPVTAMSPYFNITLDCGTVSVAAAPMVPTPEYQLQVTDLRTIALGQGLIFSAIGKGITGLQVEIYDLSGRRVFQTEGKGTFLSVEVLNSDGNVIANGVYLYVVRVRGFNGEVYVSEVRKLVVLR